MVVTMRAMGEVQMASDKVIDMVAMGHRLMSAVRAMAMPGLMPIAAMGRSACRRISCGDIEPMFINMVVMQMVEVSVVQIIGVVIMDHGRMTTVRSMLMTMLLMNGMVVHCRTPFVGRVGYDLALQKF